MRNSYAKKINESIQDKLALRSVIATQMAFDAAILAVNETFGAGAERASRFYACMDAYLKEIATMTQNDAQSDAHMTYAKAKLDEALRRILGDRFQPWDVRYSV